ncbi:Hypothetical protein GLP15_2186 [Giardia lamblia P15]|uniref:Uncharacterized protein n=1 Tax=Giardia intestinalis (strain P15) TaxID=658858 RepID=E1F6W5_GIAIA|nr:Hypothetical protein GLP15_2186 [Giardia lamblia P15]
MTTTDMQAIIAAVLEKLKEPAESKVSHSPQPRSSKTRMKEVPITAREDPDIDPYKELPEINRETHEYVFCRNGRWRAVPKQSPEQIKTRTEKMLETRLRKNAEKLKRMEVQLAQIRTERVDDMSAVEEAPKKTKKEEEPSASEADSEQADPELSKIIADHLAEKQRKESQAANVSNVFGVSVTHK